MIQQQTYVDIADNTGAKIAMCIKVLGGSSSRGKFVGSRSSGKIFFRFSEASDTSLMTLCETMEFGERRTINA